MDTRTSRARYRTLLRSGLLCFLALVPASSCDDHLIGEAVPIGLGCTRDPPLDYANFGKALIKRHCGGCHSDNLRLDQRGGAPLGIDFNKWQYVLDWADGIQEDAVIKLTMPPTSTMTPLERDLLGEWLRCDVLPQIGEVQLTEGGDS